MDWSKAKNILIAALLITNLMLIAAIYHNRDGGSAGDQEALRVNTAALLAEHGIHVDAEQIPDRNLRLGVLSVRYRSVPQEKIDEAMASCRIELDVDAEDGEYRAAAEALLRAADIGLESFPYETLKRGEQNDVKVCFGAGFDGYPLDNSQITVCFRDGRPAGIDTSWAEPVSMGRNRKRVLPAATALVKFMTERASSGETDPVTIDEIEPVYWLESYNADGGVSEDTAVPCWRIGYNDGQRAHIAAYEQ